VRPSSGAETLENETAFEVSDALEPAEVAAADDGRTPVNRYGFPAARWRYGQDAPEPA